MQNIWILTKRELNNYFTTAIAYVFLVIFLIFAGVFSFYFGNFFSRGQADLQPFFSGMPWLFAIFIPAISMRLWSEERKNGTIELLFTLPIKTYEAVVSKFLSSWIFCCLAITLTFPLWLIVNYLGSPDNGVIVASYLGSFLLAGAFLAIGSCISALTKNQVIAFVITVFLSLSFNLIGYPVLMEQLPNWLPQVFLDTINSFAFITNFDAMSKGLLEARSIIYFGSVILFGIFANVILIEAKKAD